MAELGPTDLKRLHREWRRTTDGRLDLIVDGIQGVQNVGAIIRTAAAYRVDTIRLTRDATGPDNPKVGKTALGTDRYLNFDRTDDPGTAVEQAKEAGLTVVALELADDAVPLHEAPLDGDTCLIVGNEDHGVSRAALASADAIAFAPQLGRVGSLNVSAAAAIGCYEWARRRWARP